MKDQILAALAAGQPVDANDPEIAAAIADPEFRVSLLEAILEEFNLDDIKPGDSQATEITESVENTAMFLRGIGPFLAMGDFFEGVEAGLEPAPGPVQSDPDLRPTPRDVSDEELQEGINLLALNFFVTSPYGTPVPIEGDLFVLPNFELIEPEFEWLQGTDSEGVLEVDLEQSDKSSRVDESGRVHPWVYLKRSPADGGIDRLFGRCKLEVPQRFEVVRFTPGSEGEERMSSLGPMTLTRCETDCVRIEGLPHSGPYLVLARDADGRRLKQREMQALGDTWDARYGGVVATVEVYIATQITSHEVVITATREPDIDGPILTQRYVGPRAARSFESIASDELQSQTELASSRLCSAFEFNRPAIHAHLPQVDNSLFAQVDFEKPRVVDAHGTDVPFELAIHGFDATSHCYQVSLETEDEEIPVTFDRASGRVHVRYPRVIEEVTLTVDEPSAHGLRATFQEHLVELHVEEELAEEFGLEWLEYHRDRDPATVQGIDRDGRALRQLSQTTRGDGWIRIGFWGSPTSLRVTVVRESETLEIDYEVEPTPEYPADLQGLEGAHKQCRGEDTPYANVASNAS